MRNTVRALGLGILMCGATVLGSRPTLAAEAMSMDVCPNDYSGFEADAPPMKCGCTPEAIQAGNVFGANPYYWQSSICRAAVHAGVLGAQGGRVTIVPAPDAPVFPGVSRNGVAGRSSRGGEGNQGFVVSAAGDTGFGIAVSHVEQTAAGLVLDTCPSDYSSFPADAPSLTCGCSADAVATGDVFGANPYYWQSSVCRSALHAGVVDTHGGRIGVSPAVTPVYPGVTQHGIVGRSSRGGPENQGFRVAAATDATPQPLPAAKPPTTDATGMPVQAPVAETLRSTGQVALYIRFRFNSADLDIASAPTLMQLRDALAATPGLRLMLVGHTDAVGGRDYNRDLSLKRAQAVMLWLRDQGIAPSNLAIDGKGFDEPVADNSTDAGRALNRRVQAIRIQ